MRRRPLKIMLPAMAALTLAFVSSHAIAQTPDEQQACEGNVFDLCSDAIPDEDAIVVCLRRHWSKVSKDCRRAMIRHGKGAGRSKRRARDKGAVHRGSVLGN